MGYQQDLLQKVADREARIGVVGLGYVGLPLAVEFAESGFRVTGVDVDADKVGQINCGCSYIDDVAGERVRRLVETGNFAATCCYDDLQDVDAISICVPTPLRKTRDPDMSYIIQAAQSIAAIRRPGMLIVLESTTYPGTTEEVILPEMVGSDLTVGEDIFIAYSPERIDPGNTKFNVRNTPKVVGGITAACTEAARALYLAAVDQVIAVSSPTAAEMVKLLENTFRAVNIALVNEMALMCDKLDVDVWEVIQAAATKPFGYMPFLSRTGPRRALHSGRSALSQLEIENAQLQRAIHRIGQRDQFINAFPCDRQDHPRTEQPGEGGSRFADIDIGRSVQAKCR